MAEGKEYKIAGDSGSEPVFDFYCELCREDGKMLEAEGYCVSCREYLCSTCYTHHRRTRSSRHHVLMDKDKMPKDTPLSYDRVSKDITKLCEQHSGETLKYYCKSHDTFGCSICIVKDHRNCVNVENITEMSESILESQEYKEFIQMLNKCDQRAHDNIKLVQDNLTKSQNCWREVAKSLQRFREEINSILDKLEHSILTQAETLQKSQEEHLRNVSEQFTLSLASVEKLTGEIDQLKKSRKVYDIFIKLKESKKEVTDLRAKLDKAKNENITREYIFDPNAKLKELLKSQNGIGKLTAKVVVTGVDMAPPCSNSVHTKATHVTDIEVKTSKDGKVCAINGSAVVNNNRLIIVDKNNMTVKLIDTHQNNVKSELIVSGNPWDVTVINTNKAAVTLWNKHKLLLLSVSDTLTLDREISVNGTCEGLAFSKNRLIVTYLGSVKLEIMDLSGKVIKKVDNDSVAKMLFRCPQYVCVSNNGETIYVSDYQSHKVVSLNFDCKVKSVYSDSELEGPEKMCVNKDDNVFVCCRDSRNVHMLTADLTKIQIILTQADGLYSQVFSVSHCQETNKLYVGMRNNNKVNVYQLSQ